MNQIATVGADLAKAVIVVRAADREGQVLFYKQLSFSGFAQWAATIPPCTIGMEVWLGASLGTAAGCIRPYRAADGGRVREALSQEPGGEERLQ